MLKFKTHGKWILAGEHSVLRGSPALVFPVQSKFLNFTFEVNQKPLNLKMNQESSDLEMAFWGVLEKALRKVSKDRSELRGTLTLESDIPVGAGMGASATLCVSIARWFEDMDFIKKEDQYTFAKSLEDVFHGESSGVDVAVALSNQPLEFIRPSEMKVLKPLWQPKVYLSYCGKRGVTADCVRRVQELLKNEPEFGQEIDQDMEKAVELAKESLVLEENFSKLCQAIDLAETCFERWSLVSHELKGHMQQLKDLGAKAVKPTGSGDGGFVLSLWREVPDTTKFPFEIIQA